MQKTDVQFEGLVTDVPVITGPQAQGDLLILPWLEDTAPAQRSADAGAAKPLTAAIVVITGDDGHDHTLHPMRGVRWHAYAPDGQTLGVLTVDEGSFAVLGHMKHGDSHIGPGVYVIRCQREQADEVRRLAD